jgi:hypothetical protein
MMKLRMLFMAITCQIAFSGLVFGQTPQVNNPGFENWDNLSTVNEEPTEWNSFKSATGSLAFAAAQQIKRSTVKRPGSSGTYSAVIWTKSVLGVIANGNVTTGRISMGSMTPSDPANFNFSYTSDLAFSEALTSHPDSLVVWVRTKIANSANQPRIHATLHNAYDLRDPLDANSTPHRVAEATLNYTTTGNVWVRKSIPFVYNGPATSPNYILICITTCKDPGVGTAGDSVYVDDLLLVYNPTLTTGLVDPLVYNVTSSQGTSVSVPFTLTGTMYPGNVVTAQLSDANGSFATPVVLGTLSTITSGTISGTIPAGTPTGSGYRIRVVSSNYAIVAANNGSNIQITNWGNAITPTPQVNNNGFEYWTNYGAVNEEPTEWNSFKTASGVLAAYGSQQIKRSTQIRPGSDGSYSCVIWSKSILSVVANGLVTTGQINMGSMSAADTANYNATHIALPEFSETLGGHPDSLAVWVRFKPATVGGTDSARVRAAIHDTYDLRDPLNAASTPHIVGDATKNFPATNNLWKRLSIPFKYTGPATSPNYVLISLTTNKTPGSGSGGDSLYVDDLSLIYNPTLTTGIINPLVYNVSSTQGATVSVPFTLSGTMNSGNVVTAQLSDAFGSFANPVVLGTMSTTLSGIITGTIPAGTPTGSGYRIRVVSSDYALTATNNGSNIQINYVSNSITPATPQSICQNVAGTALNVTETPSGTSREWKYATTSGGPYASFSPLQTGLSYTPMFVTSGYYYIVCQSLIGGLTVTSQELIVTVNAIPSISASASPAAICLGDGSLLSANGAATYVWMPGNLSGASINISPVISTTYTVIGTASGCSSSTTVDVTVNNQPASGTLTESPFSGMVCAGTDVSAIATAGFGGAGTISDILQYRYDGGTWIAYTSGSTLATTGHSTVDIQTYRTSSLSGCNSSAPVMVSWTISIPSSLSASNITDVSADLSWTDLNGSAWNIEYGTIGFVQGNGTIISTITSNPYNLTGLVQNTNYSFYVQSNCGGNNSPWAGPYNFTTIIPTYKTFNGKVFMEGLYNTATGLMNQALGASGPEFGTNIADQITVELHNSLSTYDVSFTFSNLDIYTNGTFSITTLPATISDSYYVVIKHRNSIETWSAIPVDFGLGNTINYDFSVSASQAYGSNLKLMGTAYSVFGGDATTDGTVDGSDLAAADNASSQLLSGYNPEDVNGDGIVDGSDMAMIDNNSSAIIQIIKP